MLNHRYREQTGGYQQGDESGRGLRGTNYNVWNKPQGYPEQHRE